MTGTSMQQQQEKFEPIEDLVQFVIEREGGCASAVSLDDAREISFLVDELDLTYEAARRRFVRSKRASFPEVTELYPADGHHRPARGLSDMITSLLHYRMIPLYTLTRPEDRFPRDEWNRCALVLNALGMTADESRRRTGRKQRALPLHRQALNP